MTFPILLTIYGISGAILLYILYKNVAVFETPVSFSEAIWHGFIVLTPIANTAVVLLVVGWEARRRVLEWKRIK